MLGTYVHVLIVAVIHWTFLDFYWCSDQCSLLTSERLGFKSPARQTIWACSCHIIASVYLSENRPGPKSRSFDFCSVGVEGQHLCPVCVWYYRKGRPTVMPTCLCGLNFMWIFAARDRSFYTRPHSGKQAVPPQKKGE